MEQATKENTPKLSPISQFPKPALDESIQVQPPATVGSQWSGGFFTISVASAADQIMQWGKNVKKRDQQLRDFWPTESYLSGALASVSFRNATADWEIKHPSDAVVKSVTDMLHSAIAGDVFGWNPFINRFSQDLYSQDNGAFIELIRDPGMDANSRFKGAMAPVIGIANLDSGQCLAGDTRILFEDGSTMSIKDVVRHKYGGYVMSVNSNGVLEPRRITNFYETKLGNRHWLKIATKSPKRVFGRSEALCLTNDHEILTRSGWKKAENIKVGEKIATNHRMMSSEQMEFLVGTMLGDAFISRHKSDGNKWSNVRFCHGKDQAEWFNIKTNALHEFGFSNIRRDYREQYQSESVSNPFIGSLRDIFYPEGKKIIPRDLLKKYFSPRLMAAWYMDDGNKQTGKWGRPKGRLYTNGFSKDDVEWLVKFLNLKGIYCNLKMTNNYPWVYITTDGLEKLAEMIAEYVPPSLRYKLPENSKPYNPSLWNLKGSEMYFDEVLSINKTDNGEQVQTFCIDVEENHNFVAAGIVVHNCVRTGNMEYPVLYTDRDSKIHKLAWYEVIPFSEYPSAIEKMNGVGICAVSRSLRLAQIIRSIMLFKDEEVSGTNVKKINIVGGVGRTQIDDAVKRTLEQASNKGNARFVEHAVLASLDPEKPVSVATVDLAGLPEGFDFDQEMQWYIAGLALDFGVDYQEFAPLPGGNIGSGAQSDMLARKSSGKGPRNWMDSITNAFMYYGVIPRGAEMIFNDKNEQEEIEKQGVRTKALEEAAIAVNSKILTPEAAIKSLVRRGIYVQEDIDNIPVEWWSTALEAAKNEANKQPVGSRGGNTIAEDAGRQDTGKSDQTVGARLRKFFSG